MMKEVFRLFYHSLPLLCTVSSLIKTTQKHLSTFKIWYSKAYVTATGFKSLREKVRRLICWKGFSCIVRKIRQRIFNLKDHRKELLKSSQFHFKGFHFKSTSSGFINKLWWKRRNQTEIRNPSETYLEPSQRSMTELFCINS